MEAAPHPWPAIGSLMLRDGLVTPEQLEDILRAQNDSPQQRLSGWRLGELLVERDIVTQAQVAQLVAEQYELPYLELEPEKIDLRAAGKLPEHMVIRFSALPVETQADGTLVVAVADPATVLFSDELRRTLRAPLRFTVVSSDAMEQALAFVREQDTAPEWVADPQSWPSGAPVFDFESRERRADAPPEEPATATLPSQARSCPPLGTLLLRDGHLTEDELEAALAQQRVSPGKRLGEILVEREAVTRTDIARAVAEQYELSFVDVDESELDPRICGLLPSEIARRYQALPLKFLPDGSLLLAVADPTSVLDPQEILDALGARLTFAVADPDILAPAIEHQASVGDAEGSEWHPPLVSGPPLTVSGQSAGDPLPALVLAQDAPIAGNDAATIDEPAIDEAHEERAEHEQLEQASEPGMEALVELEVATDPVDVVPDTTLEHTGKRKKNKKKGWFRRHKHAEPGPREEATAVESEASSEPADDAPAVAGLLDVSSEQANVMEQWLSDRGPDEPLTIGVAAALEEPPREAVTEEPDQPVAETPLPEEIALVAATEASVLHTPEPETPSAAEPTAERELVEPVAEQQEDPFTVEAWVQPAEPEAVVVEEPGDAPTAREADAQGPVADAWAHGEEIAAIEEHAPEVQETDEPASELEPVEPLATQEEEPSSAEAWQQPTEENPLDQLVAEEPLAEEAAVIGEHAHEDPLDADESEPVLAELGSVLSQDEIEGEPEEAPVALVSVPELETSWTPHLEIAAPTSDAVLEPVAEPVLQPLLEPVAELVSVPVLEPATAEQEEDALAAFVAGAQELGATTLHFSAQPDAIVVRARIDGVLRKLDSVSGAERFALARDLASAAQNETFAGARVTSLPTPHGDTVALRFRPTGAATTLAELGLDPADREALEHALGHTFGLVLVTGPAGAGQAGTLAAAVQELVTSERAVMTIEDPILHVIPGADQVAVDHSSGLAFATGLRELLSADPDAVVVGELADDVTARLAVEAATARLVASTVVARSAAGAIDRLASFGVDSDLLASTLSVVVAQRLVRRLCDHCREGYYATAADVTTLGRPADEIGTRLLGRSTGCVECGRTGFSGMTGMYEVLVPNDEIRALVAAGAPATEIERAARLAGKRTLAADGIRLCLDGLTTASELQRVLGRELTGF